MFSGSLFLAAAPLLLACAQPALLPAANLVDDSVERSGPPPLGFLDVFELEYAGTPQISPDGSQLVYVRHSLNVMSDSTRRDLWILDRRSGEARPLTSNQSASQPRWSPDGSQLVFLSRESGSTQIVRRWMDTGQTAQLTNVQHAPRNLTWSPDGRWIAFTMFVPEEPEPFVRAPQAPPGAEWAPPPRVIRQVRYRSDGAGYLDGGFEQIFLLPVEGGTPHALTEGPYRHEGPLAFAPDGSALYFSGNRNADWERDPVETNLYRVALADGGIERLTDRRGPDHSPSVSPDGKRLAYLGFDDREQGYTVTGLYVLELDGSEPQRLAADLDRSLSAPRWSHTGNAVFAQYADRGRTKIERIELDGSRATWAVDLGGTTLGRPYPSGSYSVSRDDVLAFPVTNPTRPADVALCTGPNQVEVLTDLNADVLGRRRLARVEEFVTPSSFDGREIQAWLAYPPDYEERLAADEGARFPLVLEIHGGPFANYGPRFSTEVQLYAAAGYVVLYVNPRGSTSYGGEFGNLIHHAYPGNDYDDLMSTVDAALERAAVDADRLFVTGGSGGGVLTSWIVGKTNRFRAAVVAKPVINWISFALTADSYPFFTRYWFPDAPWNAHEHYFRRSPLSLVGEIETPTMLITGEVDYRTPISESEQLYQALQLRKVPTALVRIPEASHSIAARPSHLVAKVNHVLRWFELHDESGAQTDAD